MRRQDARSVAMLTNWPRQREQGFSSHTEWTSHPSPSRPLPPDLCKHYVVRASSQTPQPGCRTQGKHCPEQPATGSWFHNCHHLTVDWIDLYTNVPPHHVGYVPEFHNCHRVLTVRYLTLSKYQRELYPLVIGHNYPSVGPSLSLVAAEVRSCSYTPAAGDEVTLQQLCQTGHSSSVRDMSSLPVPRPCVGQGK